MFFFTASISAQNYAFEKPTRVFEKGQTDIQLGHGFFTLSSLLDDASTKLPPLTIQAGRFLGNNFSLGVSYTRSAHESQPFVINDGLVQRVTNNTHQAGIRAAFHMTKLDNADLYGGFKLAMNFQRFSVDKGDFEYLSNHMNIVPKRNKATYTAFIGGRYAFTKRLSAFGEIGFSQSLLTAGIGYRL